ncbi:hypothetical protein DRP04_15560 [Archaeoglobales archaeon]|nr:MAG: hypothetical protein DRP04_15560 [Archaeoglobales archaeon]HDN74212.1 ribbon-helix-helix protein, CopG family [Archaeoglobus sp.]
MKRITITIPDSLYEKIVSYKEKKSYATISELVRDAIKKLLGEE